MPGDLYGLVGANGRVDGTKVWGGSLPHVELVVPDMEWFRKVKHAFLTNS